MFQWIAHLSYLIGTLFRSRESLEQERDELRRQIQALQTEKKARTRAENENNNQS